MTEDEARSWISERYGDAAVDALDRYVTMLLNANSSQNLISRASEPLVWVRHILDSAQLLGFAPEARTWLDIGSGAGLPGIVLAILSRRACLLVEPRRKRVEFLTAAIERLGLGNVRVQQAMVAQVKGQKFEAVTARAFAALPEILSSTVSLTTSSTIWVLPKGQSAERDLAGAMQAWQGVFHVERSLTDEGARIIVATDVRPR